MGVRSFYALMSFALCAFVLVTVAMEFVKGANAIASKDKSTVYVSSVIELTHRNTRRYGGYLVHVGVVIMFIGFTGQGVRSENYGGDLEKRRRLRSGTISFQLMDIQQGQNDNYRWQKIIVGRLQERRDIWARWSPKNGFIWRKGTGQ